jgi:hypothetical protein
MIIKFSEMGLDPKSLNGLNARAARAEAINVCANFMCRIMKSETTPISVDDFYEWQEAEVDFVAHVVYIQPIKINKYFALMR